MSTGKYAVTIRIDADDFEHLWTTGMTTGGGFKCHPDRFLDLASGEFITAPLKYAYWFSNYSSVILARSYLAAIGEEFQVASDEYVEEAEEHHGTIHHVHGADWVIFTDYTSPAWQGQQR